MPQSPLKVDGLQIEPGSGDTIQILRNASDGSMQFQDAVVTSPIKLTDLAGLPAITEILVVGKNGAGTKYTTIQSAIDAVPANSSVTNPHVVLVSSGVYSESLTLEKDGVHIVGLGYVDIISTGNQTIDIKAGVGSTPLHVSLTNLKIKNTTDGKICVKITGGSGSTVASDLIQIKDCHLEATGIGTYQIDASAANNILVSGGTWKTTSSTSLTRIQQCASFVLDSVRDVKDLQLDYDSTGTIPSVVTSLYQVKNLHSCGNVQSTFTNTGKLEVFNCYNTGNIILNGTQSSELWGCEVGNLILNNTSALTTRNTVRGSIAGAGSLGESVLKGSAVFAAASSVAVTFTVSQPDSTYSVTLENPLTSAASVTNKTTSGFTVSYSGNQTTTVNYVVTR